jgi:DNA-3-methyladenine glycosylase
VTGAVLRPSRSRAGPAGASLGRPLPPSFFDRDADVVAPALLGAVLECRTDDGVTRGRIVETEAYVGPHDPACHAAAGLTARNRCLFGPPGTAYVYFIYGMHWCVNAVTREAGYGSAVLIRALEPMSGLDLMRERRHGRDDLTNGPSRLCAALGIDRRFDGLRLDRGPLVIRAGGSVARDRIAAGPRIGIRKAADWPLRFYLRDNPFVSRR